MITLNLLSPENKQKTEELLIYLSIKNLLGSLLIFAAFSAIILLSAKLILANNFQTIIEQTTLIVKEYGGVNQKIKEINQKISSIDETQKKFTSWSAILEKIANLIPPNTTTSVIVMSRSNEEATLKGVANTRDDLLLLKTNLENANMFYSVKIPFSNLLTRENINFEFELKFNKEIFKFADIPAIPENNSEEPENSQQEME